MVLHPQSIKLIPPLTREIAQQVFPQGNPYMSLRDELGIFYSDSDLAELYSVVRHLCTRSKTEPREITLRPKDEHLAIVKRRKHG